MSLNLVRNSKLFFTTNLDGNDRVAASDHTAATTFEIQILEGFSFSQKTNNETITITEGGATPTRGQRAFNTSLAPVDFSFSTYLRPSKDSTVTAEEGVLWNALLSATADGAWTASADSAVATSTNSNVHQLQKFGLIFVVDKVAYAIDYAALGQATIDFGLDAIATVAWTGNGTQLRKLGAVTASGGAFGATGSAVTGSYTAKNTSAAFIANKLSTVSLTLVKDLLDPTGAAVGSAGTSYTVAITGGSLTINNNLTYLTPANLGVVNIPVSYYTGARAITGSINAYLKTGTDAVNGTGELLSDMLAAASTTSAIEPMFALTVNIGGTNTTRVSVAMPTVVMQIPSVDVQQVISTALEFTAQGSTGTGTSTEYDLSQTNDVSITYYHA